ncbi:MAG TPA: 30S ribosomal protein S8 [Conexivisphaerales archaeon]|nr:30S ribosomal protein S8 [Conexivisphaerales archaeon]
MPATNVLANLFTTMYNNELRNKKECLVIPASKLAQEVLRVMQRSKYIGEFEFIDDGITGKLRIQLLGRINKCGVITPRYPVRSDSFYEWERRFLPAVNVGILVVSTSQGVMSHNDAVQKGLGGRLLGYVY